ncbi:MAG: 3-hydroxyacyl-CoA dehydrogenase family protein [Lentimicrobiaceae bacterium]|nr:3-hydroxyacyl-CoA dehydrogenase family protein [Lentimicrobiaceae bacterium]
MTIGICGCGKMGTNIFQYLSGFNFTLIWLCKTETAAQNQQNLFLKRLQRQLRNGLLSEIDFTRQIKDSFFTHLPANLSNCDLVIETITENVETKQELFHRLDTICPAKCILTSNSSSILPSRLFPSAERTANFAGLHFFYPVALKNITELIITPHTSESAIGFLKQFLVEINRFHLLQNEQNAFLLNRILLDVQNEACKILIEEKISPAVIDSITKETLFPMGLFAFFDNVGIDVMLFSVKNYSKEFYGGESTYLPLISCLHEKFVQGYLGIKTQHGFFDYSNAQPGESTGSLYVSPRKRKAFAARLINTWRTSVRNALDKENITKKDLQFALAEYFGEDISLF